MYYNIHLEEALTVKHRGSAQTMQNLEIIGPRTINPFYDHNTGILR
jgi:hypothetical protein